MPLEIVDMWDVNWAIIVAIVVSIITMSLDRHLKTLSLRNCIKSLL